MAKAGPGHRFRQPVDAARPADPHLLVEDLAGQLAARRGAGGAAGQHDAAAGDPVEAGVLQAGAHHLEDLLHARPDDADQHRARHLHAFGAAVAGDRRHVDHLARVRRRRLAAAVERLDPLRLGHRRRQAARQIAGDVQAAERDAVGVDQLGVEEHGDRGGAAAHVDQRDAELRLVLDQAAERGGIGRHHLALDLEMAAGDAGGEVAHGAGGRGDQVQVDAEALAEHAARIAHAAAAVDRVADRDGVDDVVLAVDGSAKPAGSRMRRRSASPISWPATESS